MKWKTQKEKNRMIESLKKIKVGSIKRNPEGSPAFKQYEQYLRERYPEFADMIIECEAKSFSEDVSIDHETVIGPLYLDMDNNLANAVKSYIGGNRGGANPYSIVSPPDPLKHIALLINLDAPLNVLLTKVEEILKTLKHNNEKLRLDPKDIEDCFQAYDLKQQGRSNPEIAKLLFPESWKDENAREGLLKKVQRGIKKAEKWLGGHF
jgi:hypothetical protein